MKNATIYTLREPNTDCSEQTAGAQLYLCKTPGYSQELKDFTCPLPPAPITIAKSDTSFTPTAPTP